MSVDPIDPRHQEFMDAIRSKVCAVCLDSRDDKTCTLTSRVCAIEGHLPRLVAALSAVESAQLADYEAAIRSQVCTECEQQDAGGRCHLRDQGTCSLDAYLSLVLDAVEEVNRRRTGGG